MKYYIENEIFSQFEALKKTYSYIDENSYDIKDKLKNITFNSICYIGCGSSYSLCKSAALSAKIHLNINAHAIAAGDLMLNLKHYENILKNTLIIAPSRSGNTSEVILAIQKAKKEYQTPSISISANQDSQLAKVADLSLAIPWAFDESVCQTRTVTNLYTSNLLLIDILAEQEILKQDIREVIDYGDSYIRENKDIVKNIAEDTQWEKVVVLADSELEGIADEAALAFKEISRLDSYYHHILDVRHGPMVLIDDKTLVIVATSNNGLKYQQELIADIKAKGAKIISVGRKKESELGSDTHINIPDIKYAVRGIPFIFVPQAIAFFRAIQKGINPDQPEGLDPWINLNQA